MNFDELSVHRWTIDAINCFKRQCSCAGCFYQKFFASSPYKCQMKYSVIALVKKIGPPKEIELNSVIDDSKITTRKENKTVNEVILSQFQNDIFNVFRNKPDTVFSYQGISRKLGKAPGAIAIALKHLHSKELVRKTPDSKTYYLLPEDLDGVIIKVKDAQDTPMKYVEPEKAKPHKSRAEKALEKTNPMVGPTEVTPPPRCLTVTSVEPSKPQYGEKVLTLDKAKKIHEASAKFVDYEEQRQALQYQLDELAKKRESVEKELLELIGA